MDILTYTRVLRPSKDARFADFDCCCVTVPQKTFENRYKAPKETFRIRKQ